MMRKKELLSVDFLLMKHEKELKVLFYQNHLKKQKKKLQRY